MSINKFVAFVAVTIVSIGTLCVPTDVAANIVVLPDIHKSAMGEEIKPLKVAGKGKPSASFQKPATPRKKTGITGPSKPRIPRPWPPMPTPTKPTKPTKPQKGDPPPDRPLKPKGPKWKPPGI